jgi:hypothetical protein
MEIYQWLLRQKGFPVSDVGYFLYANADKKRADFNARLDFELTLIPYRGDDSWIEEVLLKIKACLESPVLPLASEKCDVCKYSTQRLVHLSPVRMVERVERVEPVEPVEPVERVESKNF